MHPALYRGSHVLYYLWLYEDSPIIAAGGMVFMMDAIIETVDQTWKPEHGRWFKELTAKPMKRDFRKALMASTKWDIFYRDEDSRSFDCVMQSVELLRPREAIIIHESAAECGLLWHCLAAYRTQMCSLLLSKPRDFKRQCDKVSSAAFCGYLLCVAFY